MKKILTLILVVAFFNCRAQIPILNMEIDTKSKAPNNSYYKDINNVLNTFQGTWLYTDGNTSLKIILTKSKQYYNGKYYEDLIIGGYQYIKDGVEKINTLADATDPSLGRDASINGNNIYNNCRYSAVNDCVEGEKNLDISIDDITSDGHIATLRLFKRTIGGQQALKANLIMNYYKDVSGDLPNPTLPWQLNNIVFYKQ